ncbi:MAG: hypothetical protein V3T83_07510 [Acidobacteriota bacterium]
MQPYFRPLWMSVLLALVFTSFSKGREAWQEPVKGKASLLPDARQVRWTGADGQLLPFEGEEEILEFLRTARVVSRKTLTQGMNRPRKMLLEKDGVQAHAVFRDVRTESFQAKVVRGINRLRQRDDYIFEAAAYRLSRLWGTDNVPPTVMRSMGMRRGTLQLWVEEAWTEAERRKRDRQPPDTLAWTRQLQVKVIFDHLIFNDDRNQGNWLIDRHWNIWLIDHTRAFDAIPKFLLPGRVYWCPRSLWQKLTTLSPELIRQQMKPYLKDWQIKALLKRWQLLRDHIRSLITLKGEKAVLF